MAGNEQVQQKTGFVVTTSNDSYPFSSRDMASEWALCAVLGGYADWAEVEDLATGQSCRIVAGERGV